MLQDELGLTGKCPRRDTQGAPRFAVFENVGVHYPLPLCFSHRQTTVSHFTHAPPAAATPSQRDRNRDRGAEVRWEGGHSRERSLNRKLRVLEVCCEAKLTRRSLNIPRIATLEEKIQFLNFGQLVEFLLGGQINKDLLTGTQ
jgi:hypothetical protein